MDEQWIEEIVKEQIISQFGLDEKSIYSGLSFSKTIGKEPLDKLELIMSLEDYFGVEFPSDQLKDLDTVGDFVKIISKLVNKTSQNKEKEENE